MTKVFWSISGLAVYAYVITILFQFGFLSYFSIHSNFVDASIQINTLYLYILFQSLIAVFLSLRWWWVLLGPILVAAVFYFQRYVVSVVTLFLILFAALSVNFGMSFAAHSSTFLVLAPGCPPVGNDSSYVIPAIYGGEAILVLIDANNKMTGGFLVKNLTDLSCKLEYKNIGIVKQ